MDLAQRPIQIPMRREGGSITHIQAYVTNRRLGYGRQNKKQKLYDKALFSGESLKV